MRPFFQSFLLGGLMTLIFFGSPALGSTGTATATVQRVVRLADGGNAFYKSTLTWVATNVATFTVERIALPEPIRDLRDLTPDSIREPTEFVQLQTQDGVLYAQAARGTRWTRRGQDCIYWEALKLPLADLQLLQSEFPDGVEADDAFTHEVANRASGQRYVRSLSFHGGSYMITNEVIHALDASGASNLVSHATVETQLVSLPIPAERINRLDTEVMSSVETSFPELPMQPVSSEVRVRDRLPLSTPAQKRGMLKHLVDSRPGLSPYLRGMPTQYAGVGAVLFGSITNIITMLPTEHGREAGLRQGDVLIAVDGKPVAEFEDVGALGAAIRGPEMTDVVLTVSRNGIGTNDIRIMRQLITLDPPLITSP